MVAKLASASTAADASSDAATGTQVLVGADIPCRTAAASVPDVDPQGAHGSRVWQPGVRTTLTMAPVSYTKDLSRGFTPCSGMPTTRTVPGKHLPIRMDRATWLAWLTSGFHGVCPRGVS